MWLSCFMISVNNFWKWPWVSFLLMQKAKYVIFKMLLVIKESVLCKYFSFWRSFYIFIIKSFGTLEPQHMHTKVNAHMITTKNCISGESVFIVTGWSITSNMMCMFYCYIKKILGSLNSFQADWLSSDPLNILF